MRIVSLLFAGLLLVGALQAHDVVWYENPGGFSPGNAMTNYYPYEFNRHFYVNPSFYEPCTVVVNLDPLNSTLISAQVIPPNPANVVVILVQVLRAPANHLETATITGEWHATGLPLGKGCDAVTPNKFTVPISVSDQVPPWQVKVSANGKWINLDTGFDCALQASRCLTGPWCNVGQGQIFKVLNDMPLRFFQRSKELGGLVSGTVTDSSGSPLSGIKLSLLYGGPTATTDLTGAYSFPRLPWGTNLITITNPTISASLNVAIPTTSNTTVTLIAAMAAALEVTNACNCTPWSAIGFGSLDGGQTPVYYAGGANPPKNGTANCDEPQVTVTTPSGATYPIRPGSSRQQNSGPNPASGTWTVTTTVCGQSKSCTVTVP